MTGQEQPDLKIKRLRPGACLPTRGSAGATGYDLYACIEGEGVLALGRRPTLVPTGIAIEAPPGYDVQVRPRSGLSARGVGVIFGTIDSDYRGEVLVTMYLFGNMSAYQVKHGDRIAQLVIGKLAELPVHEAETLSDTPRGQQGHGSTGA